MANEDNASCLHWYCRKCNIIAKGFTSGMTRLQEWQTGPEDNVVQLEGNLTGQITRLGGTVEDLVTHVEGRDMQLQELGNGFAKCMDKTKDTLNIDDVVREVQDRNRLVRNAIIFNVPESTQCNGKELRDKEDENVIVQILTNIGQAAKPQQIKRLRNFAEGKCRPIRVTFKDGVERERVLKSFFKAAKDDRTHVRGTTYDEMRSKRESTPRGIEGEKTTRNAVERREGKMDGREGESRKRRRVPRSQKVEKHHSQPLV